MGREPNENLHHSRIPTFLHTWVLIYFDGYTFPWALTQGMISFRCSSGRYFSTRVYIEHLSVTNPCLQLKKRDLTSILYQHFCHDSATLLSAVSLFELPKKFKRKNLTQPFVGRMQARIYENIGNIKE